MITLLSYISRVQSNSSESQTMDVDTLEQQFEKELKTEDGTPAECVRFLINFVHVFHCECLMLLFILYCSMNINLELKDKGVHMDVVEPEKLKWMQDVPIITKPLPDTLYNARFDFEGTSYSFCSLNTIESNLTECVFR